MAPKMAGADITVMDWDQLQYSGRENMIRLTVLAGISGESKLVDKVFVNGELVVDCGKLDKGG
ncbi:MAG: hypothetical protein ACLR5B_11490 [Blautia sp.]